MPFSPRDIFFLFPFFSSQRYHFLITVFLKTKSAFPVIVDHDLYLLTLLPLDDTLMAKNSKFRSHIVTLAAVIT